MTRRLRAINSLTSKRRCPIADHMNRWLRIASKVAQGSTHPTHKLGCIVVRGGRIISSAWNLSARYKHAEARACYHVDDTDLSGSTIYVVRWHGTCSKPCSGCMEAIRKAGIKKVVYIDWDGNAQSMAV